MSASINVYCDESCHLESDNQKCMVLGAIWCPSSSVRRINTSIRDIKSFHNLPRDLEIKWKKVSPGKIEFYDDLLKYFFIEKSLHFRALIVPDKSKLRHDCFNQDHDTFYYKMYFDMLKFIFSPSFNYRIYIDIKDTRSSEKVKKLHEVLCNTFYDYHCEIIKNVQVVRSHEIEILQLTDLLIGLICYVNRGLSSSEAKNMMVKRMRNLSGYDLTKTTLVKEEKVNLLRWIASEV